MNVVVVYIYWEDHYALRFADCLRKFPAGLDHIMMVICNDGIVDERKRHVLNGIPCVMIPGDNVGMDIGAYQQLSDVLDCDMMVCFGSSTYLKKAGWLTRMADACEKHGLGLYGAMGNRGMISLGVYPHLRSTAFWMHPSLLRAYPMRVVNPAQRYPFEHGRDCFTEWVRRQNLKALVVNWSGEYEWQDWNRSPEGYMRGHQRDMIAGDRLTEPPVFRYP